MSNKWFVTCMALGLFLGLSPINAQQVDEGGDEPQIDYNSLENWDKFFGSYWKIVSSNDNSMVLEVSDTANAIDGIDIRLNKWNGGNNQKFMLIPCESPAINGGLALNYYIMAKSSGLAVSASHCSVTYLPKVGTNLRQWKFTGDDSQMWQLTPIENDICILSKCYKSNACIGVSYHTWLPRTNYHDALSTQYRPRASKGGWNLDPKLLTVGFIVPKLILVDYIIHELNEDTKIISSEEVQLQTANNIYIQLYNFTDGNQRWKIERVEDVNLPKLNTSAMIYNDMVSYLPEINSFKEIPPTSTTPVFIFEKFIPYIYVNDKMLESNRQVLESPYYILRLEQLWHYSDNSAEVVPGCTITKTWSYNIGMTQEQKTIIEEILNTKIGAEANIGYKRIISLGVGGGISSTTSQSWESQTSFKLEEKKETTYTFSPDERVHYYQYQLIDRYSLYRMDGSKVNSFDVQTPFRKFITYPKDFGIKDGAQDTSLTALEIGSSEKNATSDTEGEMATARSENYTESVIETAAESETNATYEVEGEMATAR